MEQRRNLVRKMTFGMLLLISFTVFALIYKLGTNKHTLNSRASATQIEQTATKRALVGVRHFPGYTSDNHTIRNAQEQLLASGAFLEPPQSWKDRFPYFTVVRSENTVDIHEDDQRIIDQEIQLIAASGIDYIALEVDWIEKETIYNYALNLYNSSQFKNLLKFSLIVTAETLENESWRDNYLKRIQDALSDSQYVKTPSGKPILYMWRFDNLSDSMGKVKAIERMNEFKEALKNGINQEPYIVMMDLGSRQAYSSALEYGANARTSYLGLYASCGKGGAYTSLMADNRNQWDSYVSSDIDYIPLVTVGMDPRPKSFDKNLFEFGQDPAWCQQGTPQQIANNVKQALEWVKHNPQVTGESNTILLAAWMDITESGWLVPTMEEGNARLNALSRILGGRIMDTPISPYKNFPPPKHPQGEITKLSLNDNSILKANEPFVVSGTAPMSTRMKVRLQGERKTIDTYFLNGKGTTASRSFSIELPAVPPGGPYILTITGADYDVKYMKVYNINFLDIK
ncbi:MAG: hypothetical protein WAV30_02905 [Microgenomates group bacterium]